MGFVAAYSIGALLPLLSYIGISLAYSLKLKEMPLVDIFALSALYTVRLVAGGMATGYTVSLWLLAFSAFLFLSLAIIKRVAELNAMIIEKRTIMLGRGYSPNDLPILQMMGVGASFVSALVLALYVQDASITRHVNAVILWGIVPVLLFWQCRLWLSAARGYMHEDPIVYASQDWVSHLVGVTLIVIMALSEALY
jgi:4-hydroxybenzoate polyprenyltransferase